MPGHCPKDCMQCTGLLGEVIPCRVMAGCGLGNFTLWVGLDSVNQVGKLNSILDEEDWNVVSKNICIIFIMSQKSPGEFVIVPIELTIIALIRVQTRRKAVDIPRRVSTASATRDCRKPHEYRCLFAWSAQKGGGCDIRPVIVGGEYTMGTNSSCVDNALGNLYIKTALADLKKKDWS